MAKAGSLKTGSKRESCRRSLASAAARFLVEEEPAGEGGRQAEARSDEGGRQEGRKEGRKALGGVAGVVDNSATMWHFYLAGSGQSTSVLDLEVAVGLELEISRLVSTTLETWHNFKPEA
eukprot:GHVU01054296.1.p1 GENE.GHVU01054296.1~~GHVU01054296.1.p1  ORF type:complete len:120 (+),score=26.79 GHVU01054296.1:2-361(+)